jgi:hypothetical protein
VGVVGAGAAAHRYGWAVAVAVAYPSVVSTSPRRTVTCERTRAGHWQVVGVVWCGVVVEVEPRPCGPKPRVVDV